MSYGRLLALATLGLLPLAATQANMGPDKYAVVGVKGTDTLSLRSTGSTQGKILARIPFNTIDLRNLGPRKNGWCNVQYGNVKGWASCNYLAEPGNGRYYSGQGYQMPLPLQKEKQLNSSIVTRLPLNATGLQGYDPCTSSEWCRVSYKGYQGYIQKKYLISARPSAPAPTPVPPAPGRPTITIQPR